MLYLALAGCLHIFRRQIPFVFLESHGVLLFADTTRWGSSVLYDIVCFPRWCFGSWLLLSGSIKAL